MDCPSTILPFLPTPSEKFLAFWQENIFQYKVKKKLKEWDISNIQNTFSRTDEL